MTNPIQLSIALSLPEDGPTLATIDALARRLGITRDDFIARAVILYAEEVTAQLSEPKVMRQFEVPDDDQDR